MMSRPASHVLVCLRCGIGDLIMELPALDALRQSMPEATFTGLGAEPAVEIFDGDGRFDEVVSIQRWGIRHPGDATDDETLRHFSRWLASRRFDLIFDPSHAADVLRRIMLEAGIETRDSCPAYLDEGLALGLDGLSAVKYGAKLGWGVSVPASSYPAVLLREDEIGWARRFLEEREMTDCVGMSPGASGNLKRWPADRFAHLC
jgi:ADP-heptose:LPS heptosyltransferase